MIIVGPEGGVRVKNLTCQVCKSDFTVTATRGQPRRYCSHECELVLRREREKKQGQPKPQCIECGAELRGPSAGEICTRCSRRSGQGRWKINQQERTEKIIRILETDTEITRKQIAERFGCHGNVVTRAARILEERRRGAA